MTHGELERDIKAYWWQQLTPPGVETPEVG